MVVTPDETRISGRRFLAHLVDGMLYTMLFVIAIVACAALPRGTFGSVVFIVVVLIAMLTVVHVAFFVELQVRSGQTPGKRLAGVKVVDGGGSPSRAALVKRTIPLLIEYFYVLAFVAMVSSPYRQRLGDRWGHTYVVPSR
jgi:uncharacterized RDD family membrane protein YckC